MNNYSILIVEDDDVDVMNIQRAFTKVKVLNHAVYAKNGLEALDCLNNKTITKPLIILLDLNMPLMSGLEFLQVIRQTEEWKMVPIIVFTTSKLESDRVNSYNLNVAGYIVKPIDAKVFLDTISTVANYWGICELPK